ncbi:MAG: lipid II flippase MurJ [Planctomycetota bacterium]
MLRFIKKLGLEPVLMKYNFLALLQVIIGLGSQIIFIRYFGVSKETDAYFLCMTIVGSFQLLSLLFAEMFMQYYNDTKQQNVQQASIFYSAVFLFSLFVGIFTYTICYAGIDYVLGAFVYNIDPERLAILKEFLPLIALQLIWANMVFVNGELLKAEFHFAIGYIIPTIYSVCNIIAILLFGHNLGVKSVIYAMIFSGLVTLCVRIIYTAYVVKVLFRFSLWHKNMNPFIKKSVIKRIGDNIHNLLKEPITTNILSNFGQGQVSYFYYANRIMSILSAVVTGPVVQVYWAKVSNLYPAGKIGEIKQLIKKYAPQNVSLALVCAVIIWSLIPPGIQLVAAGKLSPADINHVQYMFLLLIPLFLLSALEPIFTYPGVAAKIVWLGIVVNSIYLVLYAGLSLFLIKFWGIYAIPVALFLAQLFNIITYTLYVFKHVLEIDFSCLVKSRWEMVRGVFIREVIER